MLAQPQPFGAYKLCKFKRLIKTQEIKEHEADEYFVIMLSDANLQRYGIRPSRLADALTSDEEVKAFAIFIGSLGDQAER